MKNKGAIVLLSGGLDSAVALAKAIEKNGVKNVVALTLYYGQKHHKEIESAKKLVQHYGVKHIIRDLSEVFEFSNCSLLEKNKEKISTGSYAKQQEKEGCNLNTYVPFRNGIFLSYATSVALQLNKKYVYYAAHKDDATKSAYPDCSVDFIYAMSEAIFYGSGRKITIVTPFEYSTKGQIVKQGLKLNVPFELTWSCYNGGKKQCGVCGTCIDRKLAFKENNMKDPVPYEK